MIKLDVAAYCHDCPGFKAVSDIQVMHDDDYGKTLCISITCVNHKQCKHIYRYLERKEKQTNGENQ